MPRLAGIHRLFVACHPPADAAAAMLAHAAALPLPEGRWTPPAQVHLTLHFIGDVAERDLDAVIESVERSASGIPACRLDTDRLISLPERGPARLLAAAPSGDTPASLFEIRRRLVRRLAKSPRNDDDQHFTPHLTLLRFAAPTPTPRVDTPMPPIPWRVGRVSLMRSVLRPGGASHAEIAGFALG